MQPPSVSIDHVAQLPPIILLGVVGVMVLSAVY
jgi:hypothetical protein